jgi:hypothetical protein
METTTQTLEAELQQITTERAELAAAIKRNNGSDRDAAALRTLCAKDETLGRRAMQLKRELRTASR